MEAVNPFTPMFGQVPLYMAGREHLLLDLERAFDAETMDPNLCTLLVGARGTGKTALLAYLAQAASAAGWIAVNVSAKVGMQEDIFEQAVLGASEFVDNPKAARLTSLALGQLFSAEWEYHDAAPGNWRTRMTSLISKLNDQGVGLLITVDEVDPDIKEMVDLVSTFQHFVRENRRVALLMAGLPSSVSGLVSEKSISFLRRARTRRLGRISDAEIGAAFRQTLEASGKTIETSALDDAVKAIEGFPFMMQLVGYRVWAQSGDAREVEAAMVRRAVPLAVSDLEESVLDATYRELSDGDVAFLEAMMEEGEPAAVSAIARRLDKPTAHANVYRSRLMERGIIGEERKGHVRFELPFFREFLARRR